jgi:hypothetical protein
MKRYPRAGRPLTLVVTVPRCGAIRRTINRFARYRAWAALGICASSGADSTWPPRGNIRLVAPRVAFDRIEIVVGRDIRAYDFVYGRVVVNAATVPRVRHDLVGADQVVDRVGRVILAGENNERAVASRANPPVERRQQISDDAFVLIGMFVRDARAVQRFGTAFGQVAQACRIRRPLLSNRRALGQCAGSTMRDAARRVRRHTPGRSPHVPAAALQRIACNAAVGARGFGPRPAGPVERVVGARSGQRCQRATIDGGGTCAWGYVC